MSAITPVALVVYVAYVPSLRKLWFCFKAMAYHVAQSAKIFSRPSSDRSFDLLNSLETMPL